jgi:outer membrane lipoprotein SlyB
LNASSRKLLTYTAAALIAMAALTVMTACSQKPSAEESAAQTQAIVDKAVAEAKQQFLADQAAGKAKQDAAAAAQAEEKAKAKAEHEAAVASAKRERIAEQRAAAKSTVANGAYPPPGNIAICANCGVVTSISAVETEGQGSGLGVIAGGLVGGLLGNQVGDGTGRDLTTIAGAVGGAFAGNKIEKNVKKTTGYDIVVRMDSGAQHTFHQATVPSLAIGQRVKIENGTVVAD